MSQAETSGDAVTSGIVTPPGTPATNGLDLDLSGRQLGDYRLLRRLGRGAMADVYLAEQGSLRRQVAFKVLKRELAADDTYVRRFHMEAQAAASLVQANIVQIYEVGLIDDLHYIAQEYVEGQNLSQYITRKGSPDVKMGLAVIRQVTAALCKAAERGIVHRDIKPENIMLARSGEVKVADFGLARIGGGEEALKLTQVGITMGTPLYMSPEQVEGRVLDPRSDIYSLGVTCYHMLAGKPPFRGDTALSVALQHVRTQPERLENLRPDLPPALGRIVHKMLEKKPEERYQSPRDLLRELRSLQIEGLDLHWPAELDELSSVETAALGSANWQATQRLQAVMSDQKRTKNNRRWLMYAAGAAAVALLLGAGIAWKLREPFILNIPESEVPFVGQMPSAEAQFALAMKLDTAEGWESVIDYYPDQKANATIAKQRLAMMYLRNSDHASDRAKAREICKHFVDDYSKLDEQYRAFGMAGLVIVDFFDNNPQESMKQLAELEALQQGRQLLPIDLSRMLTDVVQANTISIGKERSADWKNLVQKYTNPEEQSN
jgi:eukaryotic-like serine/threonine-protein kinase